MKLPSTTSLRYLFCCHFDVEPPTSTEPLAEQQHADEAIELQNIVYQTRFTRHHPIYAAKAEEVATEWARSQSSLAKGRIVDEKPPQIPPMPLLRSGLRSGRSSTEAVVGENREGLGKPNHAVNRKKSTQGKFATPRKVTINNTNRDAEMIANQDDVFGIGNRVAAQPGLRNEPSTSTAITGYTCQPLLDYLKKEQVPS